MLHFFDCHSVKNVTIKGTDITFGSNVFYNCSGLTLRGTVGSAVETYANENGIAFRDIQEPPKNGLYQEGIPGTIMWMMRLQKTLLRW